MGYELVGTPKTERMTRGLAVSFRDMDAAPHDRPLNPKRIDAYKKMLAKGLFRPVHWATALCQETQNTYRVNGKHTSTMLAEADDIPASLYAMIEHYHCDTLDDVAKLYATFDSRLQVRTANDINRAFAAVDPDLAELSIHVISLCVTGISYHRWQDTYTHFPAAERAECMFDSDNKVFINWVADFFSETKTQPRHLMRANVVAAMYTTWLKSRKAAKEFWQEVRDETGSSPKLPDRVLSRFLLTKVVYKGNGAVSPKAVTAKPREVYVKCLHAWNAWRRNTTTDLKYHASAKVPAVA